MNIYRSLTIVFFLASVSSAAFADVDWTSALQKSDEVFADLDSVSAPGCAIGVIRAGQYILQKGYGMAN